MERLADEPPAVDELDAVKRYLTGSFPLSIETPQQIANQVTTHLLLGVDRGALEAYPSRVAALTRVVDTAGWMAMADGSDPGHDACRAARDEWLRDGGVLVSTDYVLDETLTLIRIRLGMQTVSR